MRGPITGTEDILDSRDIIARIAELKEMDDRDDEEQEELDDLNEIDGDGISDWTYGASLINDRYFEDYARELADDLGLVSNSDQWPGRCIDWDAAAEELKADYTSVEVRGSDYWVRA